MQEQPERQEYGEYVIESFLGKGAIGKVWLARHRRFGRRVALKTVHLEQKFEDDADRDEFYKRLQREAELCGAMQHPNIVTLYDVGYDGELVSYLATEYVDGESLLARLRRTRPLPLNEAISIAQDVLRGLTYAHSKGIIHRDIKPANILLTAEGQAKIADFGVARPLHSSLTATRSLVGTPNYMSPEQVKTTPVTPRSDLFSAGVVLYELLTGVKPFGSPDLSGILYNIVNHEPALASEVNTAVPEPLARIVARLLEKRPEDRYASAADALADLDAVVREPDTAAAMTSETLAVTPHDVTSPLGTMLDDYEPTTAPSFVRRRVHGGLFWIITLLLAAVLAASVVALRKSVQQQQPTAVVHPELEERTELKQRELAAAREHVRSGRYAEAITAYDALLARHPESLIAVQERDEARRLLEASKAEVPRVAKKPPAEQPAEAAKPPEPEKKLSRWERFKRWMGSQPTDKKN
ncbi:MAG TPA: protein kinase [Thermoanaerobaculia bacterium]|nr:protein kinase [Thermoanaerobaculia bacterium]